MTAFLLSTALLCALLVLGFPVAFALGIAGVAGLLLTGQSLDIAAVVLYSAVDSFVLLAIPLFVAMSRVMMKSGIGDEIFGAVSAFLGHRRGGLAAGAVLCCAFFAAISGSSVTNAAAVGLIAIPALVSRGYPKEFAAGLIAAGGTLGILIPPSIPFIIYGAITDQSVSKLFIAGFIPGLAVTAILVMYAIVICRVRGYGNPLPRMPWPERLKVVRKAGLLLFLPVVVLGGIYSGWFTPTEAAAVGLALTIVIALLVQRRLTLKGLWEASKETVHVTVMILAIIAGAKLFGHVSTTMQAPQALAGWALTSNVTQFEFILVTMLVLILLGDFLDPVSIILIVVPVLVPTMAILQIDPIWYGVLIVINMELANITPPVGLNLFVIQGIQTDLSYGQVLRGAAPFMVLLVLAMLIVWWQPVLATWLPARMG